MLARIAFLEEHWQELRRPYVDTLQEGLYELRVIFSGNQVSMLKAKNRMNDFQMRFKEGKIKLPKIE